MIKPHFYYFRVFVNNVVLYKETYYTDRQWILCKMRNGTLNEIGYERSISPYVCTIYCE